MRQSEIPDPSQVADLLVYGLPGDYRVKINGEHLETRANQVRRFHTSDSAIRTLARCGLHHMRLELTNAG